MKNLVKMAPWIMALAAVAFLSGCAAVCGVTEPSPTAPPPPVHQVGARARPGYRGTGPASGLMLRLHGGKVRRPLEYRGQAADI